MRAVCWQGTNKVEVETVPDPKIINPRDAIVKITSTAICGSDLHLYNGLNPTMQKGDIIGHEFMGEVVELGRKVTNIKIGEVRGTSILLIDCYKARLLQGKKSRTMCSGFFLPKLSPIK